MSIEAESQKSKDYFMTKHSKLFRNKYSNATVETEGKLFAHTVKMLENAAAEKLIV